MLPLQGLWLGLYDTVQ